MREAVHHCVLKNFDRGEKLSDTRSKLKIGAWVTNGCRSLSVFEGRKPTRRRPTTAAKMVAVYSLAGM